jgi:hypothetical protein
MEKLGIMPGIGRSLARSVGQFGREKKQKQAESITGSRYLSNVSARGSLAPTTYRSNTPRPRPRPATKGHVINSIESDDDFPEGQGGGYRGDDDLDELDELDTEFDSQATVG